MPAALLMVKSGHADTGCRYQCRRRADVGTGRRGAQTVSAVTRRTELVGVGEDTGEEVRQMHPTVPARGLEPTVTGEPRVDAALRALDDLAGLPLEAHPGVFERVHGQLVDVLGELRAGADAREPHRAGPQQ